MPVHKLKSTIRIIVSCHSESIHNVAGERINNYWLNELFRLRNRVYKDYGNSTSVNILIDDCLAKYAAKKETLSYNLLEKVDYYMYYNPILTEKGKFQANYSGKVLKTYLEHHKLYISNYVFSSPFERTLNSIKELLKNFENDRIKVLVIPDLIEPFGRFVDKFSLEKIESRYAVLGDGINPNLIMYAQESPSQVAKRIKRAFEKIYRHLKNHEDKGVAVVMTQGGIMKIISNIYFEQKTDTIENPTLWDLQLSFDQNDNLICIDLIEKIYPNTKQQLEFNRFLPKIQPSEHFLNEQDFTVVEESLSWLAREARDEIIYSLSNKLHETKKSCQKQFKKNHKNKPQGMPDKRLFEALAQNPYKTENTSRKKIRTPKFSPQHHLTKRYLTNSLKIKPLVISNLLRPISPLEMIIFSLFTKGMSISNIKDLLYEVYGYKISSLSISIIINRLQDDHLNNSIGT
jgi:broad specificity phosphatase PhoE